MLQKQSFYKTQYYIGIYFEGALSFGGIVINLSLSNSIWLVVTVKAGR